MQTTSKLSRQIVLIGFCVALLAGLIIATTIPARAHNENDEDKELKGNQFSKQVLSDRATNTPASILINPAGKVKLTGVEVTESNWPNLKVKAWGVMLSVHVMPDAKIVGGTNTGSTTPPVTVAVGDRVDVVGDADTAAGLIHARSFRNRSTINKETNDIQTRIKDLLEQIEKLRSQLKDVRKGAGGALGRAFGR
ncbi:MAG: hypothetical protein G01um101448_433 [Parcubacteria group bacterium Gr01-1014_48]|nr:MAG: hypothetical protein Greene041614_423 [Parcubacteria group bacterium Greene0416_14]TSC73940.1 MAG: hypothetical protein G01um101448_433 [Parcubacteria group bacterium Gr01-1014_48]TSD00943.1 MAG: hypothetical protein Greene101415_593 [Parcubacteria group bacterium Greene1014_15]TSD07895.1 MAG: hypothetical protein Greene07144_621 [Parcubacteria group bacterium Greene0714_4]